MNKENTTAGAARKTIRSFELGIASIGFIPPCA
jgi:hypothetical protein